jgi:hypothetical protein
VFLVVIVRPLLWVNPTKKSHIEKDWKIAEAFLMVLYAQPRTRKMAVDSEWEVNTES